MRRTTSFTLGLALMFTGLNGGAQDLGPKGAADVFNGTWRIRETPPKMDKERLEKNYKELRIAASELAYLSNTLNAEISQGSQYVISARLFDTLSKIEKLTKQMKSKAKGF